MAKVKILYHSHAEQDRNKFVGIVIEDSMLEVGKLMNSLMITDGRRLADAAVMVTAHSLSGNGRRNRNLRYYTSDYADDYLNNGPKFMASDNPCYGVRSHKGACIVLAKNDNNRIIDMNEAELAKIYERLVWE